MCLCCRDLDILGAERGGLQAKIPEDKQSRFKLFVQIIVLVDRLSGGHFVAFRPSATIQQIQSTELATLIALAV